MDIDITLEWLKKLAETTITISALLSGFSIAIIANIIVSNLNTRISKSILIASTLSASFHLITLFAMTNILVKGTPGGPTEMNSDDFLVTLILGSVTFYLGIICLTLIISLSGWAKSKKMGIFTTIIGIITLILITISSV